MNQVNVRHTITIDDKTYRRAERYGQVWRNVLESNFKINRGRC